MSEFSGVEYFMSPIPLSPFHHGNRGELPHSIVQNTDEPAEAVPAVIITIKLLSCEGVHPVSALPGAGGGGSRRRYVGGLRGSHI